MTNYEDLIPKGTSPQVVKIIPIIVGILKEHVGRKNQIYCDQISEHLIETGMCPVSRNNDYVKNPNAYVAKAVQVIRVAHILKGVASTSRGYYIADTPEDYDLFLRSMYERSLSADNILRCAEDDMRDLWPDYETKYMRNDYELDDE